MNQFVLDGYKYEELTYIGHPTFMLWAGLALAGYTLKEIGKPGKGSCSRRISML